MTATNLTTAYNNLDTTDGLTITSIGGGQGAVTDADIVLQGDQCVSRRIDAQTRGFTVNPTDNTARDVSSSHVKIWLGSITWSLVSSVNVVIESSGSQDEHTIPSSQYPVTRGGFIPVWVDPNRTPEVNGNATLTAIDEIGLNATVGNITSNLKNINLDSITYGAAGYSLTGTSNIAEVATAEENTATGLRGVLSEVDGIYFCFSRIVVGSSSYPTLTSAATTYSDSNETIVFPDQALVATDYMGFTFDLGNASTTVSLDSVTIQSSNPSAATRRPDFIVQNTSGSATITDCNLLGMRLITLNSSSSVTGGVLDAVEITQGSADIDNLTINTRSSSGVATIDDPTFGTTTDLNNVTFSQSGTGHAIEITSPGTYDFTNINFTGYSGTPGTNTTENSGDNAAAILNSSGGSVTINVNGGDSPSVRNVNTGSQTTVVAAASFTVKNVVPGSEVRFIDLASPVTELAGVESIGVSPEGLSNVTTAADTENPGNFTVTYSYDQADAPISASIKVLSLAYQIEEVDVTLGTSGGELLVQQRLDRNYENPP